LKLNVLDDCIHEEKEIKNQTIGTGELEGENQVVMVSDMVRPNTTGNPGPRRNRIPTTRAITHINTSLSLEHRKCSPTSVPSTKNTGTNSFYAGLK
jgi:hypothetical protein